jgi:putative spermidine/putrescine transport system permease protein
VSFNRVPALDFPPREWTLSSYRSISPLLYHAFLFSIELAVVSTVVSLVLAVPAAFALVRGRIPGFRSVEALLRAPLQVPQLLIGLAIYQFYVLVGTLFGLSLRASFTGLLIAHVVLLTPYVLVACTARIAAMAPDPEEAAASLGATPRRIFFTVTLPTIRQALIAAGILAFLTSFDNVPLSLFLTAPGSTTLPVALFEETQTTLSAVVYAAASLAVVFGLVVTALLDRLTGLRTALRR